MLVQSAGCIADSAACSAVPIHRRWVGLRWMQEQCPLQVVWGESDSFTLLYSNKGDSHTDGHRLSCCPIKTFIKSHRIYKHCCPGWPVWFCSPSIHSFIACVMGLTCSMWLSLLHPYLSYNVIIWYRGLRSLFIMGKGISFRWQKQSQFWKCYQLVIPVRDRSNWVPSEAFHQAFVLSICGCSYYINN